MRKYGLTWGVFLLIMTNDLVDVTAQLFMKKGLVMPAGDLIGLHNILNFISVNASSGYLWIGIAVHTLGFFFWILTISRVDLSVAMPLGSTSYILIPIAATIFLHEEVSLVRWAGVVLIVGGMCLIARSRHSREETLSPLC